MKLIKKVYKNDVNDLTVGAYNHKLILNGNYDLYALFVNGVAVSIGAIKYTASKTTLTFDYTPKEHQGNGYHTLLLKFRLEQLRANGIKKIEVFCLKPSLNNYIKQGAKIIKEFKHGGALVVYENI